MLTQELRELVARIEVEKCEGQHLEIKRAGKTSRYIIQLFKSGRRRYCH